MRLIVFGASGGCGSHFVRLAAENGHNVTAVVRQATAYVPPAGVRVERGDVLDGAFAISVVGGHDAVVSCLGMRYAHPWARRRSPDDFISHATQNIVGAMKRAGLRRVAVISAAGVGDSRHHANVFIRMLIATSNVGVAYADLEWVEQILRGSGLDWQAVRPTTLTRRPGTGRVRIADRYSATASIPRADVAAFMLRQMEEPHFAQRTPIITAG